jgi:hypothetical protein
MNEEDRGRRIATASGGRQWGRMLEFFHLRASRHAALDGDGEEDGAQLLVPLDGDGDDHDIGSTVAFGSELAGTRGCLLAEESNDKREERGAAALGNGGIDPS